MNTIKHTSYDLVEGVRAVVLYFSMPNFFELMYAQIELPNTTIVINGCTITVGNEMATTIAQRSIKVLICHGCIDLLLLLIIVISCRLVG